MVKNKNNLNAYAEKFDVERLEEIAKLACKDIAPDGTFSDLECLVWSLMKDIYCRGYEEGAKKAK